MFSPLNSPNDRGKYFWSCQQGFYASFNQKQQDLSLSPNIIRRTLAGPSLSSLYFSLAISHNSQLTRWQLQDHEQVTMEKLKVLLVLWYFLSSFLFCCSGWLHLWPKLLARQSATSMWMKSILRMPWTGWGNTNFPLAAFKVWGGSLTMPWR